PLSAFYFDCLHLDGDDLLDRPGTDRFDALASSVPEDMRVPRDMAKDADAASLVMERALSLGHEGVMVKDPAAPYEAGRRVAAWKAVRAIPEGGRGGSTG